MRRTLVGALLIALLLVVDAGSSPSVRKVDRCSADRASYAGCRGRCGIPDGSSSRSPRAPVIRYELDWITVCSKWSRHKRRSDISTGPRRRAYQDVDRDGVLAAGIRRRFVS